MGLYTKKFSASPTPPTPPIHPAQPPPTSNNTKLIKNHNVDDGGHEQWYRHSIPTHLPLTCQRQHVNIIALVPLIGAFQNCQLLQYKSVISDTVTVIVLACCCCHRQQHRGQRRTATATADVAATTAVATAAVAAETTSTTMVTAVIVMATMAVAMTAAAR